MDGRIQKRGQDRSTENETETESKESHKTSLTISDLGWTEEQAAEIHGLLAAFAPDWEDPSMDVFDEY